RCTVQQPHRDIPQPNLGPVSPIRSRSTHRRGMSSGALTLRSSPFTFSFTAALLFLDDQHARSLLTRLVAARDGQEHDRVVSPPEAEGVDEGAAPRTAARRVIGGNTVPAAMGEGHAGAARDRLEADLDLGGLAGGEAPVAPLEDQARARLPGADEADLEALAVGVGFDEAALDERQAPALVGAQPGARAAAPPGGRPGGGD